MMVSGMQTLKGEAMVDVKAICALTKLDPRPYQLRIVNKTHQMFTGRYKNGAGEAEPYARSVLLESPTGSGKTSMAWLSAKTLQAEYPDLVVGWVAMRRNLLSQAANENRGEGHQRDQDAHMVSMFDRNPAELLQAKAAGRKVLLVVDEAQHDAAKLDGPLAQHRSSRTSSSGLSATPFRQDRVKLCFDKVIKDAGIHQLIQDGFLSKFDHFTIPNWNVETVAETYLREPKRWGKSIFYFVNLEQCFAMQRVLRQHGVVCDVVTGSTNVEDQLAAFRNGDIPALINCMKLTEGFDDPSLQTAFVRDSGKGPTMQMAGRAFRKFPGISAKQIVQGKQTRWPIIRTAMPSQQYVWQEDSWLSLTVNPKLNTINQNARLAIAQVEVKMPEFLTANKGKSRGRKLRF
jgi:superfamily II DNA or RNA helicase